MKAELTRFRVKPGMSARVDEWMRVLNERKAECLATFEREKMYTEIIFREKTGDEEFLYWMEIRGEGGESVNTSEHEIDKLHIQFWNECIDREWGATDCATQVVMIPAAVETVMINS